MVAAATGTSGVLLVLAIGLPLGIGIVARPQRGLLLLAALAPFDGLLLVVDLPEQAVAWKEVLLALTAVSAARVWWQARDDRSLPGWALALAAMAAIAVAGTALSDRTLLQSAVGLKVALLGAVAGVVAWACPLDRRERDRLVTIFAVVGAVVALVGLWQQLVGPARLHELGYAYNSVIRFSGSRMRSWSTFNQPFAFGYYLMVVVLLCGAVALGDLSRRRNRLILWAMPLYAAGLFISVVKGAWIAAAVGIAYLAVARYRALLHALPVVAAAGAAALVVGAGAFFASDSLFERFDRWSQVPQVVTESPWGKGIGAAGAAAAKAEALGGGQGSSVEGKAGTTLVVYQPDDHYVKVAYEIGVLGVWVFVLALAAAYGTARAAAARPGEEAMGFGVSAVVVAAAVAGAGATFFEIFPLDYLVWLVVGVVSAPLPAGTTDAEGSPALLSVGPARGFRANREEKG